MRLLLLQVASLLVQTEASGRGARLQMKGTSQYEAAAVNFLGSLHGTESTAGAQDASEADEEGYGIELAQDDVDAEPRLHWGQVKEDLLKFGNRSESRAENARWYSIRKNEYPDEELDCDHSVYDNKHNNQWRITKKMWKDGVLNDPNQCMDADSEHPKTDCDTLMTCEACETTLEAMKTTWTNMVQLEVAMSRGSSKGDFRASIRSKMVQEAQLVCEEMHTFHPCALAAKACADITQRMFQWRFERLACTFDSRAPMWWGPAASHMFTAKEICKEVTNLPCDQCCVGCPKPLPLNGTSFEDDGLEKPKTLREFKLLRSKVATFDKHNNGWRREAMSELAEQCKEERPCPGLFKTHQNTEQKVPSEKKEFMKICYEDLKGATDSCTFVDAVECNSRLRDVLRDKECQQVLTQPACSSTSSDEQASNSGKSASGNGRSASSSGTSATASGEEAEGAAAEQDDSMSGEITHLNSADAKHKSGLNKNAEPTALLPPQRQVPSTPRADVSLNGAAASNNLPLAQQQRQQPADLGLPQEGGMPEPPPQNLMADGSPFLTPPNLMSFLQQEDLQSTMQAAALLELSAEEAPQTSKQQLPLWVQTLKGAMQTHSTHFKKKFLGQRRQPSGTVELPPSAVHSGDLFGAVYSDSRETDPLSYFSQDVLDHLVMAIWINGSLHVVEQSPIRTVPYQQWMRQHLQSNTVVWLPLSAAQQHKFDAAAAVAFLQAHLGEPYAWDLLVAANLDGQAFPSPLDHMRPEQLFGAVSQAHPTFAKLFWEDTINSNLKTQGLTTQQLVEEAGRRNTTFADLLALPLQSSSGRWTCASFSLAMFQAAGLVPRGNEPNEFIVKDVYRLHLFEEDLSSAGRKDVPQPCIQSTQPFCQLSGEMLVKLNGYNILEVKKNMAQ